MGKYEHIIIENRNGIAVLTINRHERRNMLAGQTIEEISRAFDTFAADEAVTAVVIAGAGGKAFSAGADIDGGFDISDGVRPFVDAGHSVFQKIEHFPKPVVAAVEGYAFGGGCELMLSCDMSVAAENVVIGMPEVGLGLLPGWGGTQKIPRIAGKNIAMELLLGGGRIKAQQAKEIGLVNRVVPRGEVMGEALEIAARLGRQPAHSIRLIKDAVLRGLKTDLDGGLEIEAENFVEAAGQSEIMARLVNNGII